jgi:predicted nucleotidyltransferase
VPLNYGRRIDDLEVYYDEARWQRLHSMRSDALAIMMALQRAEISSITHGSIARGDVSNESDIDIFIPEPPSSFAIETAIEMSAFRIGQRLLVQATPNYAAKGYIEIDGARTVSFPLMRMRGVERDFYRFGGRLNLQMLRKNVRVPGVNKQLMLIEPTDRGHIESSVVGSETTAVKLLGVSTAAVRDRVRALLRRSEVGRTGVFIKRELLPSETFEEVLKALAETKPEVRRRFRINRK